MILIDASASISSPVAKSQHDGVSEPGMTHIFLPIREGIARVSIVFAPSATSAMFAMISKISMRVDFSVMVFLSACTEDAAGIEPAILNSFQRAIYCCVGFAAGVRIIACVACGIVRSRDGTKE